MRPSRRPGGDATCATGTAAACDPGGWSAVRSGHFQKRLGLRLVLPWAAIPPRDEAPRPRRRRSEGRPHARRCRDRAQHDRAARLPSTCQGVIFRRSSSRISQTFPRAPVAHHGDPPDTPMLPRFHLTLKPPKSRSSTTLLFRSSNTTRALECLVEREHVGSRLHRR